MGIIILLEQRKYKRHGVRLPLAKDAGCTPREAIQAISAFKNYDLAKFYLQSELTRKRLIIKSELSKLTRRKS